MKNFVGIMFVTVFVLLLSVSTTGYAVSSDEIILSELTESECIEFLQERGVTIPEDSEDELLWGAFAKEIICRVEENPNVTFAFGYTELLEFANDIKTAVNEYYSLTRSMHVVNPQSVSRLLYSTVYGEWDDSFLSYNCYGYAIETYESENPGDMRGLLFNMRTDIAEIAYIVAEDLEYLDYTVLAVSENMPAVNVSAHTRLICVRKDLDTVAEEIDNTARFIQDYHFMKLGVDGNWYHKPGQTNTLMFNGAPSNNRSWIYEISYRGELYRDKYWTYESTIYYIAYTTPHSWEYIYSDSRQHTIRCTICGDSTTGNCELEYSHYNSKYHKGTCTYCGYITTLLPCSYNYSYNGADSHMKTCTICGYTGVETCELEYTHYSSTYHKGSCVYCGHTTAASSCGYEYSYNMQGTHTVTCVMCGDSLTENCNLSYFSTGYYTHKETCSICGYTSTNQACSFSYMSNGDQTHAKYCTICDNSLDLGCTMVTTYSGNGMHHSECTVCGGEYDEACTAVKTYCGSATLGDVHALACEDCGHSMGTTTESCTFEYIFTGTVNGHNVHSRICTECDYVSVDNEQCFYGSNNICFLCGQPGDLNSGGILKTKDLVE